MNDDFSLEVRAVYLHPVCREQRPEPASDAAAGIDLRACLDAPRMDFAPGERKPVRTGLAIEITRPGIAGFVFARSGLGAKRGLTVSQGVGLIDPDYRGEIMVWLTNTGQENVSIERGERIAQLVFLPYYAARLVEVQGLGELGETDRGAGGFGSSGRI